MLAQNYQSPYLLNICNKIKLQYFYAPSYKNIELLRIKSYLYSSRRLLRIAHMIKYDTVRNNLIYFQG